MIANRLVETRDLSREEWLEWRNAGIGSSDIAAAAGYNPYKSPARLFDEKIGLVDPDDLSDNLSVEAGILFEDDITEIYERRTHKKTERVNAILQHPEHKWMLANLDRRVRGASPRRLLECKLVGEMAHKYGDYGDPEIEPDRAPTSMIFQVQQQLAVTGYDVADLAVLVGTRAFYIYEIARDEAFIANMTKLGAEFWGRVQAVRDAKPSDIDELKKIADQYRPAPISYKEATSRFGAAKGTTVQASPAIVNIVNHYEDLKTSEARLKAEIEATQLQIATYMRDATELELGDQTILTWREQTAKRLDIPAHKAGAPDCASRFEKASTSRVMRRVKGK